MNERLNDAQDAEATIALPTPGRRRTPYSHMLDRKAAPADLSALGGLTPLVGAANPILAAVPQIRHALRHPDPAGLRARLREQLGAFERAARAAQVPEERLAAARFALCALVDDSAGATPWGREWGGRGLLAEVEGESASIDAFFDRLDQALQSPADNRELLEFFYICLALGFEGRYRRGEGGRQALVRRRNRAAPAARAHRWPRWDGRPLSDGAHRGWSAAACAGSDRDAAGRHQAGARGRRGRGVVCRGPGAGRPAAPLLAHGPAGTGASRRRSAGRSRSTSSWRGRR